MTTPAKKLTDTWQGGEAYESYVGRWSRPVAREFVGWLGAPPACRWLDVGCGTGALADAVLDMARPSLVHGVDSSAGFVEHARAHVVARGAKVAFAVGDATDLAVPEMAFDVAASGLVLNFIPEWQRAVEQMRRAVVEGGTVAAYVWDYGGEMWMLRRFWDVALTLEPGIHDLHEGYRFERCRPEALAALFEAAGLSEVETRGVVVPTVFADFDDYWTPFLGNTGPAPAYVRSLDDAHRAALREALRQQLPPASDGSISLTARAWAVRGRRLDPSP